MFTVYVDMRILTKHWIMLYVFCLLYICI